LPDLFFFAAARAPVFLSLFLLSFLASAAVARPSMASSAVPAAPIERNASRLTIPPTTAVVGRYTGVSSITPSSGWLLAWSMRVRRRGGPSPGRKGPLVPPAANGERAASDPVPQRTGK
jgi:hypothetical protein